MNLRRPLCRALRRPCRFLVPIHAVSSECKLAMNQLRPNRSSLAALLVELAVTLFALMTDCYAAQPRFSVPFPAWVGAVAYSSDGTLLAVGTADGTMHVLQAKDGHELAVRRGHTDAITSVAFTVHFAAEKIGDLVGGRTASVESRAKARGSRTPAGAVPLSTLSSKAAADIGLFPRNASPLFCSGCLRWPPPSSETFCPTVGSLVKVRSRSSLANAPRPKPAKALRTPSAPNDAQA
jgi:hypothetical protein